MSLRVEEKTRAVLIYLFTDTFVVAAVAAAATVAMEGDGRVGSRRGEGGEKSAELDG